MYNDEMAQWFCEAVMHDVCGVSCSVRCKKMTYEYVWSEFLSVTCSVYFLFNFNFFLLWKKSCETFALLHEYYL